MHGCRDLMAADTLNFKGELSNSILDLQFTLHLILAGCCGIEVRLPVTFESKFPFSFIVNQFPLAFHVSCTILNESKYIHPVSRTIMFPEYSHTSKRPGGR